MNATPATGSPVQTVPLSQLGGLVVTGGGGADTLTVNTPGASFAVDASAAAGLSVEVDGGTVRLAAGTLAAAAVGAGATLDLTAAASVAGPATVAGTLQVDNGGSGSATTSLGGPLTTAGAAAVDVTAGTLSVPASVAVADGSTLTLDGPGTLAVPNWTINNATVVQQAGTVYLPAGSLGVGGNWGSATYDLQGGTLDAGLIYDGAFSTGRLVQTGGTLASTHTEVGTYGYGTLAQSGGTSSLGGLFVGSYYGTGEFDLSGGGATVGQSFDVGTDDSTGTVRLSGTGSLVADSTEDVGDGTGSATFAQTGGTNAEAGPVLDNGTFTLSAGTLSASNLFVGDNFGYGAPLAGQFTQTGGRVNAVFDVDLGGSGNAGTYALSGGTLVTQDVYVGLAGGAGTLTQTGGSIGDTGDFIVGDGGGGTYALSGGGTLSASYGYVGYGSAGAVDQAGGTVRFFGDLSVGGNVNDPAVGVGSGTYTLGGTAALATAATYVGYGGAGAFTQTGGTHTTGLVVVDGPTGTVGTYTRSGGSLYAGGLLDALHPAAANADGYALATEGTPFALPLSAAAGTGQNPLTGWSIDWGDGTSSTAPAGATFATHAYLDGGEADVAVATALYGPGYAVASSPVSVGVADVPAVVSDLTASAAGGGPVVAGATVDVSATFTDPGPAEHHQATIDWGDGTSSPATVAEADGSGTITATHVYDTDGTLHPTLTITDDGGGTPGGGLATVPFAVAVGYVAPTVALAMAPAPAEAGQAATLDLDASGPEAAGVTSWTINWGDSTVVTYPDLPVAAGPGGADWALTHTYAATGSYVVTATPTDAAGRHAAVAPLTVSVVPPPDPTRPVDLAATAVTADEVDLSWVDPSGTATGFAVRRSTDGGQTFDTVAADVTPTGGGQGSLRDFYVADGTAYEYEVVATNPSGQSTPTLPLPVTTPMEAPAVLNATADDDNDIDLSWDDYTTAADPQFEIDRMTPGGAWADVATVDSATDGDAYTDSGLTGGTTYQYRIRELGPTPALDSAFTGPASEPTPLTTPDAPAELTATESAPGEVDLTWYEDSPIVTGYRVTATPAGGGPAVQLTDADGYDQGFAATGLTPGVVYSFAVTADNNEGAGGDARSGPSDPITATPPAVALAATAPATVAEGQSLALTLSAPAGPGSPIVSWQVTWDDGSVDTYPSYTPGASLVDVHSLPTGDPFEAATVAATDAAGHTFALPEVDSDVVPTAPTGVSDTVVSDTEVDLAWTDTSQVATGYTVERADGGSDDYEDVGDLPAGTTTYSDIELTPSTQYRYKVVATGGLYTSTQSAAVSAGPAVTTPDAGDVTLAAPAEKWVDGVTNSFTLSWTYSGSDAGGFEVEAEQLSGRTQPENFSLITDGPGITAYPATATSPAHWTCLFAGETDQTFVGQQFAFRVRADRTDGTASDYSPVQTATADSGTPTLSAEADDAGTIQLNWSYTAAPVTGGYDVFDRPAGTALWLPLDVNSAGYTTTDTSYTYAEGVPGEKYEFTVGVAAGDLSLAAAVATATYPQNPTQPVTIVTPSIRAAEIDPTHVLVSWGGAGGNVRYSTLGDEFEVNTITPAGQAPQPRTTLAYYGRQPGVTSAVESVVPNEPYYFEVEVDADPNNPPVFGAASVTGMTPAVIAPPIAPIFARAIYDPSVEGGAIRLSWANSSNNEDGFQVYLYNPQAISYSPSTPPGLLLIRNIAKDVTKATFKPPAYNGVYNYWVRAFNKAGPSTFAECSCATIGGPNVTLSLLRIRADIVKRVSAMSPIQKDAFDESINDQMSDNWDITPLSNNTVLTPANSGVIPTGLSTVSVDGSVYEDAIVDYWLYGIFTLLAAADPSISVARVAGWRVHEALAQRGAGDINGRLAWFRAGYVGDIDLPKVAAIPDVIPVSVPPLSNAYGPMNWKLGNKAGPIYVSGSD